MNLREDKHWSYGARSSAAGALGQRPWMAAAPVQIDKTAESIKEMRARDRRVRQRQGAADAGGGRAASRPSRSAACRASYETAAAVLGTIGGIVRYGRPDDYVVQAQGRNRGDDAGAGQAAAATTLDPDALTWVVVGDLEQIEAPVRALNLGEVTVVDADGKPVTAPAANANRRSGASNYQPEDGHCLAQRRRLLPSLSRSRGGLGGVLSISRRASQEQPPSLPLRYAQGRRQAPHFSNRGERADARLSRFTRNAPQSHDVSAADHRTRYAPRLLVLVLALTSALHLGAHGPRRAARCRSSPARRPAARSAARSTVSVKDSVAFYDRNAAARARGAGNPGPQRGPGPRRRHRRSRWALRRDGEQRFAAWRCI